MRSMLLGLTAALVTLLVADIASAGCRTARCAGFGGGYGYSPPVALALPSYAPPVAFAAPVYSAPVYSAPVYSAPVLAVPAYAAPAYTLEVVPSYAPSFAFYAPTYSYGGYGFGRGFHGHHGRHR